MTCRRIINLEAYFDAYFNAAGILEEKKFPLFRSARGRTVADALDKRLRFGDIGLV